MQGGILHHVIRLHLFVHSFWKPDLIYVSFYQIGSVKLC